MHRTLRHGDCGADVRELQEALAEATDEWAGPLEVTERFDSATETRLIAWKRRHGMEPLPIADDQTRGRLGLIESPPFRQPAAVETM